MGVEVMTEAQSRIVELFESAKASLERSQSPGDSESDMATFLHEVRLHPEERDFVIKIFCDELERPGTSWEFLQFCFHALRWAEMKHYVREGLERSKDNLRARAIWSHILESFDEDWSDAEFYKEFSTS